ncbi:MAG: hypothetical protein M0007_09950 [Actinomycetota bacterium]|nr:hypothetical protein [Actinomycetota bacterium]
MFAHFALPDLGTVARRTTTAALVLGVAALVAGFGLGHWLLGLGGAVGIGLGTLNFHMAGAAVIKVSAAGGENTKRPIAMNTLFRMGVVTVVAFGLFFLSAPLGFGVLGGVALFQIMLLANVARAMTKFGPMVDPAEAPVIDADAVDTGGTVPAPTDPSRRSA